MPTRKEAALIRLVRTLVYAVIAAVLAWLVGPGPGDLFGPSEAVFVVPVLTSILTAIDKYVRASDTPPVV